MAEKNKKKNSELKIRNEYDGLIGYFMSIFVCAIGVIFPLFVGPRGYENMTHIKNDLFYVITLIMLAAVISMAIVMTAKGFWQPKKRLKELKEHPMSVLSIADVAVIAYLLVMTVSSLFSGHPDIVFNGYEGRNDGLIVNCLYVLIYFIVSRLYVFKPWHIFTIIGASCIVSLMTILNFFGADVLGILDHSKAHFALRMISTIGNINFVSWYTAMMFCLTTAVFVLWESKYANWLIIPTAFNALALYYLKVDSGRVAVIVMYVLLFYFCLDSRKKIVRYFFSIAVYFGFAVAGISFFTIFFNNYQHIADFRENLIFMAAALIVCIAVKFINIKMPFLESISKGRLYLITIMCAAVLAAIALFIIPQKMLSGFVYEFSRLLRGEFDDSFGTNRMYIWKRSLTLFKIKPIFGYGQDVFGKVFMDKFSEDLINVFGYPQIVDKAHNIYVQILVCTGILGLASYMTFLLSIILKAFKAKNADPFMAALVMAVISYSVQGCFLFSLPFVTPFFWMFAGMIASSEFTNRKSLRS